LNYLLDDFDDGRAADAARLQTFRQEVREAREVALRFLRKDPDVVLVQAPTLLDELLGLADKSDDERIRFWNAEGVTMLRRIVMVTDTVLVVLGRERMTILGFEPGVVEPKIEDRMKELMRVAMTTHDWTPPNPIKDEWKEPPEAYATGMCPDAGCVDPECSDPRGGVFSVRTDKYRGPAAIVTYWAAEPRVAKIAINGTAYEYNEAKAAGAEIFGETGSALIDYAVNVLRGAPIAEIPEASDPVEPS